MKPLNAIIVDDEPTCVELLSLLINAHHPAIRILAKANGMQAALEAIELHKHQLHLLFLDIDMPGGDGFTLLQHIPDITFKIIFTTAYDTFAIRAIKFSALDYLLKPIDSQELALAIDKLRSSGDAGYLRATNDFRQALRDKNMFKKLAVSTLTEVVFIPPGDILYLESDNNYTTIYTADKKKLVSSKNIGHYEELLDDCGFFRISNSFLVNLKKVERFVKGKAGSVVLESGQELQVSASRKEELLRMLALG